MEFWWLSPKSPIEAAFSEETGAVFEVGAARRILRCGLKKPSLSFGRK
jgi:hypothetical protein